MDGKHILIVDDESAICRVLSCLLKREGFEVSTAVDGLEALAILTNQDGSGAPVDLLLTDFNLPYLTGLEIVDALTYEGIAVPVLMMSGNHDESLEYEAYARGCLAFLKKPFEPQALLEAVCNALDASRSVSAYRS